EPGAYPLVAWGPCRAGVCGVEGADRRDGHPHLHGIGWMRHNGMEAEAAEAGLPAGAGGMLPQTLHVGPRDTPVRAAKESGWVNTGVEGAVGGSDVPDFADLRPCVAVRETLTRLR